MSAQRVVLPTPRPADARPVPALAEAGELGVCDMAWIAERSESLVGHDLQALRQTGPVRSRREGQIVLDRMAGAERVLLATAPAEMREGAPR